MRRVDIAVDFDALRGLGIASAPEGIMINDRG